MKKNSSIISALIGVGFFAWAYIGIGLGLLLSVIVGGMAFGASEVFLYKKPIKQRIEPTMAMKLAEARRKTEQIADLATKVEDEELIKGVESISKSAKKIINAVEKDSSKYHNVRNFFDYYLPVTVSILSRYDEIENQKLTSDDSIKFMKNTEEMIKKIDVAFKNQLGCLYQKDIIDTDAEMKVFDTMLKADGIDVDDINVKEAKKKLSQEGK